jgi:hypothetical protein
MLLSFKDFHISNYCHESNSTGNLFFITFVHPREMENAFKESFSFIQFWSMVISLHSYHCRGGFEPARVFMWLPMWSRSGPCWTGSGSGLRGLVTPKIYIYQCWPCPPFDTATLQQLSTGSPTCLKAGLSRRLSVLVEQNIKFPPASRGTRRVGSSFYA